MEPLSPAHTVPYSRSSYKLPLFLPYTLSCPLHFSLTRAPPQTTPCKLFLYRTHNFSTSILPLHTLPYTHFALTSLSYTHFYRHSLLYTLSHSLMHTPHTHPRPFPPYYTHLYTLPIPHSSKPSHIKSFLQTITIATITTLADHDKVTLFVFSSCFSSTESDREGGELVIGNAEAIKLRSGCREYYGQCNFFLCFFCIEFREVN